MFSPGLQTFSCETHILALYEDNSEHLPGHIDPVVKKKNYFTFIFLFKLLNVPGNKFNHLFTYSFNGFFANAGCADRTNMTF